MDTQQNPPLNLLGDTSASSGGCCGGGGCGDGAAGADTRGTDATATDSSTGTYREAAPLADTITGAPDPDTVRLSNAGAQPSGVSGIGNGTATATITQEFLVTGMTCGHCVASVTEEVGAVDGIAAVEVVLKKGGASRVTVTAQAPVDESAVRAAVEEAGYQLA
ncbi:heavy-metal-associated domain-containing protein [Microcella flavibacter]|uniref:heavy-metal-associated domain-containing protein n=1 Tax=Microcella flavibacter TaxID=1804990 RepID=UPI001E53C647|nr:heavy-metal-associated domain-containing protein [Microcella flavibacter]